MSRIARTPPELSILRGPDFAKAVELEYQRQRRHWGPAAEAHNNLADWHLILDTEMGEAAAAVGKLHFETLADWKAGTGDVGLELVQVAAVARSFHEWLFKIDRVNSTDAGDSLVRMPNEVATLKVATEVTITGEPAFDDPVYVKEWTWAGAAGTYVGQHGTIVRFWAGELIYTEIALYDGHTRKFARDRYEVRA